MRVAVIGGTGIDEMTCFAGGRARSVTTRFGSADVIEACIDGRDILFLPRHGRQHSVPPGRINYRAQMAALKRLAVDAVVGVCAVGSLTADLPAGSFAVLSDFIDLTKRRVDTFFDEDGGPVAHTDFTHPYCPVVSAELARACAAADVTFEPNSLYVGVEGPRYETPAEIRLYASWGGQVIGMTNLPEVVLAREAGLCYGALAVVTNLASGLSPTRLAHDEVRSAMAQASRNVQRILMDAISAVPEVRGCSCGDNSLLVT